MIIIGVCSILIVLVVILFYAIGNLNTQIKALDIRIKTSETVLIALHKITDHQDILNDIIDKHEKRTLN